MKKRIISMILAICCVLTLLPMGAVRVDAAHLSRQEFHSDRKINPLYEDVLSLEDLPPAPERLPDRGPDAAGIHDHEVARPLNDFSDFVPAEDAVALIREQLVSRSEEFTIQYYMVANMSVEEASEILMALAMAHTGVGNEGDYLNWQWLTFDFGGQYWENANANRYYAEITYYMTYFTTAEQEAEMDEAVEDLLTELDLEGKTDYAKVKTVYDYICDNVTYDFDHLEDPEYYLMFSAYAALVDKTAVCQGYALLLYRLMLELGIDIRVIVGVQTSTAIPHAWNIVNMRDQYYNLDATWDAGMTEYSFFLKTEADFVDHTRDPAFNIAEFHRYYPMATSDLKLVVDGVCGTNINYRLNAETGELVILGSGAMDDYPRWGGAKRDICTVKISKDVTYIGNGAFEDCINLAQVNLPDGLTSIGSEAFSKTALVDVYIPDSVTAIGSFAFLNCPNLESIRFPRQLEELQAYICGDNKRLKNVELPENLKVVGESAFENCVSLESITLPETVSKIDPDAFYGCTSIESIRIPAAVWNIGHDAVGSAKEVYFVGDAPRGAVWSVAEDAKIYYPRNNETWNEPIEFFPERNWIPYDPPAYIVGQPKDTMTVADQEITFSVDAYGEGLTYQWQWKKPDGYWQNSSNGTTDTLTVVGADYRDGYQYRCVVTDKFGNKVTSKSATLSVVSVLIVEQPTGVETIENTVVEFKVEAAGKNLQYQWQALAPEGTWQDVTGGNTNTLSMEATLEHNGYRYRCVISDAKGNQVITDEVTLLVKTRPVLEIISQPTDQSALVGSYVDFSIRVDGDRPTYQWQWRANGTEEWKDASNGNSRVLTVEVATHRDGYQYRCVVTDYYGQTVTSDVAVLTINDKPIIIHGITGDVTAVVGTKVKFDINASLAEGGIIRFQWQWRENENSEWADCYQECNSYMNVVAEDYRNGYQYRCVVTDHNDNVAISDPCTLTVVMPEFTRVPVDQNVMAGEVATFVVEIPGEGLTYQWQWKAPDGDWKNSSNGNTNTLRVEATAHRNGYQYRCVVSYGKLKTISDAATLRVRPASTVTILEQPKDAEGLAGEKVTFTVKAEGNGLTYQWQWKKPNGSWQNSSNGNTDTLTVEVAAHRVGYQYRCVITDANGAKATTDSATLNMRENSDITILEQPKDAEGLAGEKVTFSVKAEGEGLTYQWQWTDGKNGWKNSSNGNTDTLTVEVAAHRVGYQYRCVITDANGSRATTSTATLKMRLDSSITIVEQPKNAEGLAGEKVTFTVKAEGEGLTYQWQWTDGKNGWKNSSNGNTDTLTVEVAAHRVGYQYRCVITDAKGNKVTTDVATLGLRQNDSITILEQPQDASGQNGEKVTFTVKAEGEGLTYQWQWTDGKNGWKNSSNGNTDTLTVEVAAHRVGYQYRCVITDAKGNKVTTEAATLQKAPAELKITKQPVGGNFPSNQDIVITVEAEGDGLTYAWYGKQGLSKPFEMKGFTTSELRLEADTHYNGMTVWCVITDQYGNQVTSEQVTIQVVGSR